MRFSCSVAVPVFILAEATNIAKLVAVEALADSKVDRVGLTVKNLGLADKSAFI